jgi:hypothetical protein
LNLWHTISPQELFDHSVPNVCLVNLVDPKPTLLEKNVLELTIGTIFSFFTKVKTLDNWFSSEREAEPPAHWDKVCLQISTHIKSQDDIELSINPPQAPFWQPSLLVEEYYSKQ